MEVPALNIAINRLLLTAILHVFSICIVVAQQSKNISRPLEKDIANKVDHSFRFTWSKVSFKRPLRHHFFSIKFSIDKSGNYTDIQLSDKADTSLFTTAINKMESELPKDLFKKLKIKNIEVVFPVFVFVVPKDTLYTDFDGNKKTEKPALVAYDKEFNNTITAIWSYKHENYPLQTYIVFPPVVRYISEGIPDINSGTDSKSLRKHFPTEH